VNRAVQPSILYFKREKMTAGPQHTVNFYKRAILQFARSQMMQDENGDRGGEGAPGEG
jgi:hypothetical protein